MAYFTRTDLLKEITADHLALLTKPDNNEVTAQQILDAAIEKSDSIVDSFLLGSVKTPMETPPANVVDASMVICISNLHGRIDYGDMAELWAKRREDVMNWLRRVQDGKANIVLPADTTDETNSSVEYWTEGRNISQYD